MRRRSDGSEPYLADGPISGTQACPTRRYYEQLVREAQPGYKSPYGDVVPSEFWEYRSAQSEKYGRL